MKRDYSQEKCEKILDLLDDIFECSEDDSDQAQALANQQAIKHLCLVLLGICNGTWTAQKTLSEVAKEWDSILTGIHPDTRGSTSDADFHTFILDSMSPEGTRH